MAHSGHWSIAAVVSCYTVMLNCGETVISMHRLAFARNLCSNRMKDSHSEPRAQARRNFIRPAPATGSPPTSVPTAASPWCPFLGPGASFRSGLLNLEGNTDSLQLKSSCSFHCECSVSSAGTVTGSGHSCFHITLQWLRISRNILYTYHHLEIETVVRLTTRSRCLTC